MGEGFSTSATRKRKALPSPVARTGHPKKLLALERACHPPGCDHVKNDAASFVGRRSDGFRGGLIDKLKTSGGAASLLYISGVTFSAPNSRLFAVTD